MNRTIFLVFALILCAADPGHAAPASGMPAWKAWTEHLSGQGYTVSQGGVRQVDNAACALFEEVFQSCFANNPEAPYIIPEPPIDGTYVGPTYGPPFTVPGTTGNPSNMFFRLADSDALVVLFALPPQAAYLGYQTYLFTRAASAYGLTPPSKPKTSPDPSRYEIFGSLGNDINNVVIENRLGSVWNNDVAVYITTSNSALAEALVADAVAQGLDKNRIFVEPVGKNVKTGTGAKADDLVSLFRYALPRNQTENDAWMKELASNVVVYRVSAPAHARVARFATPLYTKKGTASEEAYANALQELTGVLSQWLAKQEGVPPTEKAMTRSLVVGKKGELRGFVGKSCIAKGYNCLGDNEDTDSYRFGGIGTLGSNDYAIMTGINHTLLDNAAYISVGIYNGADQAGVAGVSQTNPPVVGFESGTLTGSAEGVLKSLGLYESASPTLKAQLPYLYAVLMARTCAFAASYCVPISVGDVPLATKITVFQRAYIKPGTTTGANPNVMPSPNLLYKPSQ